MKHVFEFADLPIRPTRSREESLPGYAYRLCNANGHLVPISVRQALTALYRSRDFNTRRAAAHVVAKLVGSVSDDDWPIWQEHRGWRSQSASHMRICPVCLSDGGLHLALWELPLVHACPQHRINLRDTCDCGKSFSWQALKADWRCGCGTSLRNLLTQQADDGSLTLSRVVYRATNNRTSLSEVDDWNLDSEDSNLSLADVYARAEFLHRLQVRYLFGQSARRRAPRSPGTSTGRFFQGWQRTLREYIEAWLNSFFDTKGTSTPAILLPPQSPVTRLLNDAENPDTFHGTAKDCSAEVTRIIRKYLVPMSWPSIVLIRADVERELLIAWLNIFTSHVERAPPSIRGRDRAKKGIVKAPTDQQRNELRRLLISLTNAILRGDMPLDYRRAARAWPALPDFAGGTGEEWLAYVIAPLYETPLSRLRYLRECFESFSWNVE